MYMIAITYVLPIKLAWKRLLCVFAALREKILFLQSPKKSQRADPYCLPKKALVAVANRRLKPPKIQSDSRETRRKIRSSPRSSKIE